MGGGWYATKDGNWWRAWDGKGVRTGPKNLLEKLDGADHLVCLD